MQSKVLLLETVLREEEKEEEYEDLDLCDWTLR
jgi:hypothetical protein